MPNTFGKKLRKGKTWKPSYHRLKKSSWMVDSERGGDERWPEGGAEILPVIRQCTVNGKVQ